MGTCAVPGCSAEAVSVACTECSGRFCETHRPSAAHSPTESRRGPSRSSRGTTWPARLLWYALTVFVVSVLVIGFTPATMPEQVPHQVAAPVQEAADASASFAAGVLQPSAANARRPVAGNHSGTPPSANTSGSLSSIDRPELEAQVHEKINEKRTEHGLSTLDRDPGLREIARYHSGDMAANAYFAHTAPDGETMQDRYDMFGYECRVSTGDLRHATGGENIYMMRFSGQSYSEEQIATMAVEGWMDSPGHRENILRPYWEHEGIGVFATERGGQTEVYVTQNFC